MDNYNNNVQKSYYEKYVRIKDEFETYQNFAESTIQMLTEKNIKLEKKLDSITNIVEISKYINSYLSDKNLIPMINDMIIGILGATYSTIYIMEDNELVMKACNLQNYNYQCCISHKDSYKELLDGKPFILNSREPLFDVETFKSNIHSLIGVPIYLREKFIGYIIVEHALNNFFAHDHIKFISTIANQIAIALENNALYNQIRENSIRDPLLGIYNRKQFYDIIENKLDKEPEKQFALVMIDMDNFKQSNDLYGHQFGDEVLKQTVKLMENNIDKEDIIARYGGEEIVICISKFESLDEVYYKIENIRTKLSENIIFFGEVKGSITASFGISYYPIDGNTLNEVLSVADSRLYIAKGTGKNKVINN